MKPSLHSNVLIIGGLGLIGYHIMMKLYEKNFKVTILELPSQSDTIDIPDSIEIIFQDYEELNDDALQYIVSNKDIVVFAAGADDRIIPHKPSYPFFHKHNVKSCMRLIEFCNKSNVRSVIIVGSYFTHFNRRWPDMDLTRYHTYIRSRQEQIDQCMKLKNPELKLVVLELPFVLGAVQGGKSIWQSLIKYIRSPLPLFYIKGGTSIISVHQIAEVVFDLIQNNADGIVTLGNENVTWKILLSRLSRHIRSKKIMCPVPISVVKLFSIFICLIQYIKGKESGLSPLKLIDLLSRNLFLYPDYHNSIIIPDRKALDESLVETINSYMKS
jgi:nucleoside-diphosphate-sugar epimerase